MSSRDGLGVGVIGCGYWGKNLVRNFAQLGELAGVYDANPETAGKIAGDNGSQAIGLDDMLADDAIGAVAIAAPAALHYQLARQALEAGKHVFVEKPLSLTVAHAEALLALAGERKRTLMVGHLLQYHPAFLKLKELVSEGRLGTLRYVYSNRLNFGKIRQEEDILWSFAPHDISMILSLVGEEPDEVSAVGASYLSEPIVDVTTMHMSFPSGQKAHIFVSWLHPFKDQKLIVVGERSMAIFDDCAPWEGKLTLFDHVVDWTDGVPVANKAEGEAVAVEAQEPLLCQCRHFVDCSLGKRTPRTDGAEGLRVLRVLHRASESLMSSEPKEAVYG